MTKWIQISLLLLLGGGYSRHVAGEDHYVFAYYSNNIEAPLPQSAFCMEKLAGIFEDNTDGKAHPIIDNQPKSVFLERLGKIADQITSNDALFFFYSGHGKSFQGNDSIITNEPPPNDIVSVQSIIDIFHTPGSQPSASLFVFDACRGSLGRTDATARTLTLPDIQWRS